MAYLGNDLSKEKEELRPVGDCLVCGRSEGGVTEVINSWILKEQFVSGQMLDPIAQSTREKPTQESSTWQEQGPDFYRGCLLVIFLSFPF